MKTQSESFWFNTAILAILVCACSGCSCTKKEDTPAAEKSSTSSNDKNQAESAQHSAKDDAAIRKSEQRTPARDSSNQKTTARGENSANSRSASKIPKTQDQTIPSTAFGSGEPGGRDPREAERTAQQAHQTAKELRAKAEVASRKGHPGEALSSCIRAWELVNSHPDDPACKHLSAKLLELMKSYDAGANRDTERLNEEDILRARITIE